MDKRVSRVAAIGAALIGTSAAAQAGQDPAAPQSESPQSGETTANTGPTVTATYNPDYFSRFAPRTALDMVNQVPDFALSATSDARGLGQASQNVLVNGERVSGKTNDAQTTLQQISAASVDRIDILDGATLGIPGLTGRVANVVVHSRAMQVQFHWDSQYRRHVPDQLTVGGVSMSGRVGASDVTLSLSNDDGLRRGGRGPETVRDGNGMVTLTRIETDRFRKDLPRLAGTLSRRWSDGTILNLNLSGERLNYLATFDALATPVGGGTSVRELFVDHQQEWKAEGGGDLQFNAGGGKLKLIVLQSFSHNPTSGTFTEQDVTPGSAVAGDMFSQSADSGESVGRAEYSWTAGNADWQFAVEGAYNFLDVTSQFANLQPDGSFLSVPLPGGDSFVDEWRSESQLTRSWPLSSSVAAQVSIGMEFSRIRQTSAGGLSRRFTRPKGLASLTWTASPRLTANASIERKVGQLSFYDFTAAVDVQNGTANAGNVHLVPEQTWDATLELTRSLGRAGSITIGGFSEWITDIVDRIPISATEEAVGNLPRARRMGITARGTLLLDTIGLHGVRLNANAEFVRSRVTDPVTGLKRKISGDQVREWQIELRHDIPNTNWAWGGLISDDVPAPIYRLNQTFRSKLTRPVTQIYVENKDVFGLTIRAGLRNLLNTSDDVYRQAFVNRRNGPVAFTEQQYRHIHLIGILSVRGSF